MKSYFVIMVLLVLPLYSFCQTAPNGIGTIDDPYLISNIDNLRFITNDNNYWNDDTYWNSDKHFKQTQDINAYETRNWNYGKGFKAIGNLENKFKANYDGQGYTISNLYINRKDEAYCGLFGLTVGAVIKNVRLDSVNITGDKHVGGIIGYASNTDISNSSSNGTILGDNSASTSSLCYCGGIVGIITNGTQINNCSSSAEVNGTNFTGGLVGTSLHNITLIE